MVTSFEFRVHPVSMVLWGLVMYSRDCAETAFAQRQAQYSISILAQWTNPGESQPHIEWARGLAESIRPFSSGAYLLNFLGDEGEDTIKAAFGANYDRLAAIKKSTPENFLPLEPKH